MDRVIAYIDGFNLYYGLKDKGWRRYFWLDLKKLVASVLKPKQQLVCVKYFTAMVSPKPHDPNKHKRQKAYLEALGTLTDFHVFYGHYLEKNVACRKCGANWRVPEEKMTDVNIAVELMTDAFQDGFDTALLISADSDLAPPVERVLTLFPEKRGVAVFPPDRSSKRLASAATSSFRIGRGKIARSQFPNQVVKPDGYVLQRPTEWK